MAEQAAASQGPGRLGWFIGWRRVCVCHLLVLRRGDQLSLFGEVA